MSIYLNKDSKIIVQGMTGGMGAKHTTLMLEAGSNIVGGVNARKAGTTVELAGKELPVYGNVKEAMASMQASLVNAGGTKATDTSAPVSVMASLTEPKTGSSWPASSTVVPALRALTPPTMLLPASSIRVVCFAPIPPVMPWTMILLSLFR